MRTFTDNRGRVWTLVINVAALKRVKAAVGVDLVALIEDGFKGLDLLTRRDVIQFVDTLYVLCRDQAEAAKVTDEDFGAALFGDSLAAATDAFIGELVDFFPQAQREAMTKARTKMGLVEKMAMARAMKALEEISEEEVVRSLEQSTRPPELSESTPAPSPGGN